MPFLITATDHPNKNAEREEVRQAHRDYLASFGKRLLASGALLDENGENIIGGSSLFDTDDREEALLFESEDPYAQAGIRADVKITQWRLRWWVGEFDADGHSPSKK
ncbi:YciI family protein [Ahrensia sp. R2A130]|uniref:YciI family protein n=1 Tax=Ahrensia sp. R2A130 TaxID=744979 RepID=UPI0001E09C32|nr:YciI family protein [Ahrensia sp. R2A130]EFL89604.1 Ycii-related protein [Ahrensia sp. R2A130]